MMGLHLNMFFFVEKQLDAYTFEKQNHTTKHFNPEKPCVYLDQPSKMKQPEGMKLYWSMVLYDTILYNEEKND